MALGTRGLVADLRRTPRTISTTQPDWKKTLEEGNLYQMNLILYTYRMEEDEPQVKANE